MPHVKITSDIFDKYISREKVSFYFQLNILFSTKSKILIIVQKDGRYEYLPYDTHESVPTQQRERMVADPFCQYQKL